MVDREGVLYSGKWEEEDDEDILKLLDQQRQSLMAKNESAISSLLNEGYPDIYGGGASVDHNGVSSVATADFGVNTESQQGGKDQERAFAQRFRDLIGNVHAKPTTSSAGREDGTASPPEKKAYDATPYFDFESKGWVTTGSPAAPSGGGGGATSSTSAASSDVDRAPSSTASGTSSSRPSKTKNIVTSRMPGIPPLPGGAAGAKRVGAAGAFNTAQSQPMRPPLPKIQPLHHRVSPRTAALSSSRSASSVEQDASAAAAASQSGDDGLTDEDRANLAELRDIASGKQQLPEPAFYAIDKRMPHYREPVTLEQAMKLVAEDDPTLDSLKDPAADKRRLFFRGASCLSQAEEALLFDILPQSCFEGQKLGGRQVAADAVKEMRLKRVDSKTSAAVPAGSPSQQQEFSGDSEPSSAQQMQTSSMSFRQTQRGFTASAGQAQSSSSASSSRAKDKFLRCLRSFPKTEGLRAVAKALRRVIQAPGVTKYRRIHVDKLCDAVFHQVDGTTKSGVNSSSAERHGQTDPKELLIRLLESVGWKCEAERLVFVGDTCIADLRMAVQYIEVLLDGHHDPATVRATSSTDTMLEQAANRLLAVLQKSLGEVVLDDSSRKRVVSHLAKADGSQLVSCGLSVAERRAVQQWAGGKWPAAAVMLAVGQPLFPTGVAPPTGSGNIHLAEHELQALLQTVEFQQCLQRASAGLAVGDSSSTESASYTASLNKFFVDQLCATSRGPSSDEEQTKTTAGPPVQLRGPKESCLRKQLRVRWELLRIALGGATHVIAPLPEEILFETSSGVTARRPTDQSELSDWAEALLSRAARTMAAMVGVMQDEAAENASEFGEDAAPRNGSGGGSGAAGPTHTTADSELPDDEQIGFELDQALRILGLDAVPESTKALKSVYHNRCLECHPDKGGSKEAFQRLHEAYTTIKEAMDPTKAEEGAKSKADDGDVANNADESEQTAPAIPATDQEKLSELAALVHAVSRSVVVGTHLRHATQLTDVLLETAKEFVIVLRSVSSSILDKTTAIHHKLVAQECGFEAVASYRAADLVERMIGQVAATKAEAESFHEQESEKAFAGRQSATQQLSAELAGEVRHLLTSSVGRLQNCVEHAHERCRRAAVFLYKVGDAMLSPTDDMGDEVAPNPSGAAAAPTNPKVKLLRAYVERFSEAQWRRAESAEFQRLLRIPTATAMRVKKVRPEQASVVREELFRFLREVLQDDPTFVSSVLQPGLRYDFGQRRALLVYLLQCDFERVTALLSSHGISVPNETA
ncbi:unnamed protein product [Amoebophrya sp. A120]|nr:unnamed protein product [Amoebophrya sp. A120]|eukprot:GSA120T00018488001.1